MTAATDTLADLQKKIATWEAALKGSTDAAERTALQASLTAATRAVKVVRLDAGRAKLAAKVQARPKDPKVSAWKARIAEYDTELKLAALQAQTAAVRAKQRGGEVIPVPSASIGVKGGG